MSFLWKWVWRQQFDPGLAAGWLVNPFFFARRGLLRALDEFFPRLTGVVLDVGCGRKPYRRFASASRYVGVDIDTPVTRAIAAADVFYDGRHLPFPDGSFDVIRLEHVLEHLPQPVPTLKLLRRLLVPGGWLVLTVPSILPWREREDLDRSPDRAHLQIPVHLAHHSEMSLLQLLEEAELSVVALKATKVERFLTAAARRPIAQVAA